jgi:hypothetical protein
MKRTPPNAPDRRSMPAYGVSEAAHYLGIPVSTLRYWANTKKVSDTFFRPRPA